LNNTLEGINSRITEVEAGVNDLEDKMVEITGAEQSKERRMKRNEDSLRDLWDNIKCINICIVEVSEREEREKRPEKIFEDTLAENFPNMGKEIVNQVEETLRIPGRINPRKNTPRLIVIKLIKSKDREKILKAAREKLQITSRLSADFSTETLQARRGWHDIFKVMKGKKLQPRMFYPARLSFRFDGGIKSFSDNPKGTYLGRKHKRKINPNNQENSNRIIHIDNYLKCKWIKCTNQKT